jgi:hypothetical protein
MGRRTSEPEKRAKRLLFDRFKLSEIRQNDGSENPTPIYLNDDHKGTSIISERERKLFSDYPRSFGKAPKNYTKIVPDYVFRSDFIEVKGNISGTDWISLPRDSLNDNIRLALLRMKIGCVKSVIKKYDELQLVDREIVACALEHHNRLNPTGRYYAHWDNIISVIASPNQNLIQTVLHYHNMRFPIKLVSGMQDFREHRLFVIDYEIMNQWEKLQSEYEL